MNKVKLFFGALGVFAFSSMGCAVCGDAFVDAFEDCDEGVENGDAFSPCSAVCTFQTSTLEFDYVVLFSDGAGGFVAPDAADTNIASVGLLVGFDVNGNGTLDGNLGEGEVFDAVADANNQVDANGDGVVDATEIGFFSGTFLAGLYDTFAVEALDAGNTALLWQPFDQNVNATRFSFSGGIEVSGGARNFIPFNGNNQVGDELQIFIGF